ncbi:MAG TPA: Mov34/MPN/PAD-1 family protein [Vulgatibacter sp.]
MKPDGAASLGALYSASVLAEAARHLEACHPEEGCGAIVRLPDGAQAFLPVRNVAEEPGAFAFDLREQISLWEAQDRGDHRIEAIVHSHCDAPAALSERDRAGARLGDGLPCAFPGLDWLVFSIRGPEMNAKCAEIRLFRWVGGDLEEAGAFPVARPGANW